MPTPAPLSLLRRVFASRRCWLMPPPSALPPLAYAIAPLRHTSAADYADAYDAIFADIFDISPLITFFADIALISRQPPLHGWLPIFSFQLDDIAAFIAAFDEIRRHFRPPPLLRRRLRFDDALAPPSHFHFAAGH
jgi:hypothetical protein